MELATALVVSMIVVYAAVQSVMALNRSLTVNRQSAAVDNDAKVIVSSMVSRLQGIGGHGIPVEGAYALEDSGTCGVRGTLPACGVHDRLTVVSKEPTTPVITKVTGVTASRIELEHNTCGAAACCAQFKQGVFPPAAFEADPRPWYILANDGSRELVYVSAVGVLSTAGGCYFSYANGTDQPPAFSSGDVTGVGATAWSVVPVDVTTWRIDSGTNELRSLNDTDLDANIDASEEVVLAPLVQDLQFALGYDVDNDGKIRDTGGPDDEWFGNHASDMMTAAPLADAQPEQLRIIGVGLVAAEKAPFVTQGADMAPRVFGGTYTPIERANFRAATGYALLRNQNTFF